jgi:hypothetical protein
MKKCDTMVNLQENATPDNLQLTGQNLGRVFNFKRDHLHTADL